MSQLLRRFTKSSKLRTKIENSPASYARTFMIPLLIVDSHEERVSLKFHQRFLLMAVEQ